MKSNNSNLRAWVHWKKEYLSRHPDEDEQMFVDTIDNLLKENKKLRELWAAVQVYKQTDIFTSHAAVATQREKNWNNILSILSDLNQGNF